VARIQKARLDTILVERGLAPSRERARALILAGHVTVDGQVVSKAGTPIAAAARVELASPDHPYVGRGGLKLAGALDAFAIDPHGHRALDVGASTGGFTDVLLDHGAAEVVAVDVGYGQLVWRLRSDERVRVHDRTNVRTLTPDDIDGPVDVVVADLSFISLRTVLPALVACTRPGGNLLPMVKPQFEVGRERLGSGGVVRDPDLRRTALGETAAAGRELGLVVRGAVASPLPGPSGNVEFFLWFARDPAAVDVGDDVLDRAVAEGPR
jgi:23S rRNA (cytidine1920-2'-O)/16S rRNA (cytidine1409-2'-O)-methyltransferase